MEEHLGPVLRLGAAGPRVDGHDGVVRIVGPREHPVELGLVHRLPERRGPGERLRGGRLVALLLRQLAEDLDLREVPLELRPGVHGRRQRAALTQQRLGPLPVVPERGIGGERVYLGDPLALALDVKDDPGARRYALSGGPRRP
jgi:hypothetical protein